MIADMDANKGMVRKMRTMKVLFALGMLSLLLTAGVASARVVVTTNMPSTQANKTGAQFEIRVEVQADETGNYSVMLVPAAEFNIDSNTTKTLWIEEGNSKTFIFDMSTAQDLQDGKYGIDYVVYKGLDQVDNGTIMVRAGKQAPGFEGVLVVAAVLVVALVVTAARKH
jgi:hypothetical protein